jgi:phosphate transport system ATP-binding protein
LGAAGSGKTTLLRLVNRLVELDVDSWRTGDVVLDGIDVRAVDVQVLRRTCGYVFERPTALPGSVLDNVGFALRLALGRAADQDARVEEALKLCNLAEEVHFDTPAHTLGAGQLQLLGLARCLASRPRLLLVDEPTARLHPAEAARFESVLVRLAADVTVLLATRDTALAGRVANTVSVLHQGAIVETAPAEDVFMNPQHPATQAYLSRRF